MIRETGRVWSGAVMTPRNGQMFVEISARWQVPTVTPPASAGSTADDERVCSSSTWIGLDGTRAFLHSSLPQIGTAQNVYLRKGKMEVEYFAWWEWWTDGHPGEPNEIKKFEVKPGDCVGCSLKVDTPTWVTFRIQNETTGQDSGEITKRAPDLPRVKDSPLPAIQRVVSGATAEWVTERPSDPKKDNKGTGRKGVPYDLANYGTVVFKDCVALSAPAPGVGPTTERRPRDGGAALRDMIQIRDNRARRISIAKLLPSGDVATYYTG